MRVLECDLCGQVIQADDDVVLTAATARHMAEQHADADMDEGKVRDMVEREAYDATDA